MTTSRTRASAPVSRAFALAIATGLLLLGSGTVPALAQGPARGAMPPTAPRATTPAGPRTRDPFRQPAVKVGETGPIQEVEPPLPGDVTSILVAGPRSVVTFRDANDRLTIVGVGESAGAWTVQSVRDDGAVLRWRGRFQSYTRLLPLRRGQGASKGVPSSAGTDTHSALPAGDIPLLPPLPSPHPKSKPTPAGAVSPRPFNDRR